MKLRQLILLAAWLLPALLVSAASFPSAAMFKGQVTVVEVGQPSLAERCAEIFRQFARQGDGTSFFTAWAFPTFERINSRRCGYEGRKDGPMSIKNRNGRIVVNANRDHTLNISAGPVAEKGDFSWGVLLFLNRVEKGHCWSSAVQLLSPDRDYDLGNERLAWLGTADEAQGLECINGLLAQEINQDMRHDLAFILYLFNGQDAVSELIGLARHDPDTDVRKEAIFWLGQKASTASVKALGDLIATPEALEIKKHAIFALSQLPEETGTPLLIDIARYNPHARLRKEALFWLGQSDDSRALDLFAEILTK